MQVFAFILCVLLTVHVSARSVEIISSKSRSAQTLEAFTKSNIGTAPKSGVIPYYGEKFFVDLKTGSRNEKLLNTIKYVLKNDHIKNPSSLDQVVERCSSRECYRHQPIGYDNARVFLLGQFYLVDRGSGYAVRDVYCNKEYDSSDFRGGPRPGPNVVPDNRVVNVEHTWPQSRFSGRYDKGLQKSDLHHLFPTDSELNSVRSSFKFGEVVQDERQLKCRDSRFGVSSTSGDLVFQPPQEHRGNVARALFYFATRYDLSIDSDEEVILRKWHNEDPVDEEELRRQENIYSLQGNRNPFVDYPGIVDLITDF